MLLEIASQQGGDKRSAINWTKKPIDSKMKTAADHGLSERQYKEAVGLAKAPKAALNKVIESSPVPSARLVVTQWSQ